MKKTFYILAIIILTGCISNDKIVSLVKYNYKFGYIDRKGNWVIKPTYDSLGIFYNGYASSFKNKKVGVIDSKGNLIINYHFDFIGNFENGLALVIKDDSINYIDIKGDLISPIFFTDGEDFNCGLAPVKLSENSKWGYINTKGELALKNIYDYADEFKDNKAEIEIGDSEYYIDINGQIIDTLKSNKHQRRFQLIGSSNTNTLGRLNNHGDTIMPMKYKSFGYIQQDKFWFNNGIYYGLADTTGKVLSDSKYEYLSYFSDNGLAVAKLNGKYGFIDKNCRPLIDFRFQAADGFKYGLAAVKLHDKWGFIDENGNFVIDLRFDYIGHQFRPIKAKFEPMYNYEKE